MFVPDRHRAGRGLEKRGGWMYPGGLACWRMDTCIHIQPVSFGMVWSTENVVHSDATTHAVFARVPTE